MSMDSQHDHKPPATRKTVTQKDVAERCGVHRSTVSFVFKGDPCIPEATAAHIRQVAAEMGYDPALNAAARRLIGQKYGRRTLNHLIALGFPDNFHCYNFWLYLFQGVLDTLAREGFGVVTTQLVDPYQLSSHDFLPVLKRGEVDGFIVQASIVPFLKTSGVIPEMPLVALLHKAKPSCPGVLVNEHVGAYQAMCHLLDLGHRTILHFTLPEDVEGVLWPRYRLAGVRQALEERGLSPEHHLRLLPKPHAWQPPLRAASELGSVENTTGEDAEIRQLLADFLAAHPEVTAIQALNDADAIRIFYHLKALGIRVPEDISLIGCDDVDPLLDENRNNILTTIHLPLREVGQEAARLMLRVICGDAAEDETVTLQTTLAVRKTTGPARVT